MDTPDKAADMADSQLADLSNKDSLLASWSQFSIDLRQYELECSTNPLETISRPSNFYGALISANKWARGASTSDQAAESSWLLRHYVANKERALLTDDVGGPVNSRGDSSKLVSNNCSINNHIYDNIGFADSPILRSLSRKCDADHSCARELLCSPSNGLSKRKRIGPIGRCFESFANKFRYFLACYVLLGITLSIYSRNALSLAAVGMIAHNAMNKELADLISRSAAPDTPSELEGSCPIPRLPDGLDKHFLPSVVNFTSKMESDLRESIGERVQRGELVDWTPSEQGLIFAAGSVGNLLIAIPMTRFGEIYGTKWIIFCASLGATLQAALMPLVSPCNVIMVIIFQVIFNGLTYGADCVAYTLFAHWLSPTEMAFFVSCLLICYQLGTILSSFATAKILSTGLSWDWCFYTPAILCAIWTIIWILIGASNPAKSRIISQRELNYLRNNSKIAVTAQSSIYRDAPLTSDGISPSHSVSWLKLVKDPNIWAICSVKFSLRYYFSAYLSLMPTYLSSVAHMSVETIGKMSVVQSFIGLFSGMLTGFLTKSLVNNRPFNMSLATVRKFFQSIVNFGLALSLIVFTIYDCDQWVTIVTLTLGGICINFYVAAALQLPLDLSPTHCGLITSFTNTLALGQALGAPVSGMILNSGPKDRKLWCAVWSVAIVMNLLSGLIFIMLVDSKPRNYSKDYSNSSNYNELTDTETTD